jgi:hypothetical protein
MATRLPIVPLVIRNSESVAGRNAATLNPGTVDIAVLPPVSAENWTLRNLQEQIEQIRTNYLETLAEWPVRLARHPHRNVVSPQPGHPQHPGDARLIERSAGCRPVLALTYRDGAVLRATTLWLSASGDTP